MLKRTLKCGKCGKLLAVRKKGKWILKNLKGTLELEDSGKNTIECICGEKTQIGTWDPRGPGLEKSKSGPFYFLKLFRRWKCMYVCSG